VVAERYGLLGDLGREAAGDEGAGRHVTVRDWLERA